MAVVASLLPLGNAVSKGLAKAKGSASHAGDAGAGGRRGKRFCIDMCIYISIFI